MKINRKQVHDKFNGRCAYCGCEIRIKEMQVDHIISKRNFNHRIKNNWRIPSFLSHLTLEDLNHIDNLNPSCRVCNNWKKSFDLETFRSELNEQTKRLNDYSSNFRIAKKYGLIKETYKTIVFYFEDVDHETKDKKNNS